MQHACIPSLSQVAGTNVIIFFKFQIIMCESIFMGVSLEI